ncbi:hypothetical protein D3C87_1103760 [compost metagenome]
MNDGIIESMKVKDLSPNIQAQIVELETQNILPILASVGLNLTEENMRDQLKFFRESEVVLSLNAGAVDGFAIYDIKETTVMIVTFNLRKFNSGRILRELLGQISQNLENSQIQLINSQANHTNSKSINFHRRMGFIEVGVTEHHIEYQIHKNDLMQVMQRRGLKPNADS